MTNAIHRTPCLETAEVKLLLNGPRASPATATSSSERRRASRLLRLRGIQFRRHRQLGRGRQARRRVDRQRRAAARSVGRRHPPLRAVPRQSSPPRRPHGGEPRPALRDALAARGARHRAAAAPLPALRPARGEARGVRQQDGLGARELFPAAGRERPSLHARHPRVAAVGAGGAARLPRGRRGLRPDVVLQIRDEGPRRARRAAAAVRQRR